MSDSLRILTYNTQLRSWAMEVGADQSFPPSETAEDRAKLIANNILASRHDYDVVCLNEVFDEDARDILIGALLTRFPFAITKADVGGVEVAWPGKPILPINPVSLLLSASGISFIGSWLALGTPKLEDSGVMLFSRWPFALKPITQAMADLLDPRALSELTPLGMPQVAYSAYRDSSGNDAWAAKGVVYARIERDAQHTYHVFASHTQADDNSLGEHAGDRVGQMAQVADFIRDCVGPPPFGDEVFFLGDLNINGGQANLTPAPETKEWRERFVNPGLLSDSVVDAWGRAQCTGEPGGLRDPGTTAPVVYAPPEQRLDYCFRSTTTHLAVQHLYIDYDLATVPPGIDGVSYLSDHRPLGSDLNLPQPHCTPVDALVAVVDLAGNFRNMDARRAAGVKWYRFNQKGTYEFRVDSAFPVAFEVYLDTDLSRPRQQYREEFQPDFGIRYVLASAPFFVKVFCTKRDTEYTFDFRAHQHLGASISDAIDLVPENPYHEAFPAGQLLNVDVSQAPWDDTDSKWFRFDTPRTAVHGPIKLGIDVTPLDHADSGTMLFVGREDVGGNLTEVGRAGPSSGPLHIDWSAHRGDRFFIAVQRKDRAGVPLSFDVVARTNVSVLLGGKTGTPRLVCEDETSGWGSDDIRLEIEADGATVRNISNDEIGDFDDDDVRDLDQWIPEVVVYTDHIGVKVVEEDDIDSDDIGDGRLPPINALVRVPGVIEPEPALPDGTVRVRLRIAVDDGTYEFRASVTRWHEKM
jgi:hypothetical protein